MAKPAVAMFEITGRDGEALQRFYGDLFDWQIQAGVLGPGYGLVPAKEPGIGGGVGASQQGVAGHVTVYVEVDDVAAYLARAEELGGRRVLPPTEIPQAGRTMAFFADPDGNVVGLSHGVVRR